VLLGAGILLLAYATVRRIYPERAALALGAAAFVAFLPQHLATVSQVGNDCAGRAALRSGLVHFGSWVLAQKMRDADQRGLARRSQSLIRVHPRPSVSYWGCFLA